MAIKRIFSAGGIVLKKIDGETKVLLTQHSGHKGWEFPKGHIEVGESAADAALREVEEEAGVKAEIIEKAGNCQYFYFDHPSHEASTDDKSLADRSDDKGERVFKTLTYFFMKYVGEGEATTAFEVSGKVWLAPKEVLEKLTYKSTKDLWEKAGSGVERLMTKV